MYVPAEEATAKTTDDPIVEQTDIRVPDVEQAKITKSELKLQNVS